MVLRESRLTLLLRLRHGMHADETAFLFPDLDSEGLSLLGDESGSSFGRIKRGGISTEKLDLTSEQKENECRRDKC